MRILLLLCLLIPVTSWAETSLWRISQGKHSLMLGGSVHLLAAADHPLPDEFEQAFRESDILVLETDMTELTKPEAQINLAKRLMYKGGTTLKSKLKPATYRALARYCRSVGFPVSGLASMKPALVVLTLTVSKLNKAGIDSATGVDQFFLQKALKQGKPIAGLESLEAQMVALESMGAGQEDAFILSTIKDLNKADKFMNGMTQAWRTGNLAEIEKLGIQSMRQQFPQLNQTLLISRNKAWLAEIEKMLFTPEREFILVGALHLAGEQGLLTLLQKRGYSVQKY